MTDVLRDLALAVVGKLHPWKLAGEDDVKRPTMMVVNDTWYKPLLNALGMEEPEPIEYHQPSGDCGCGERHDGQAQ